MNEQSSSEFESRIRDLLAAPDADGAFVGGLRAQLLEASAPKTAPRVRFRLALGIALGLALLIAGLLVFSPQVVEAMRRLLGFIPGVGYVEQGPALQVLSAPVTVTKQGLTFTIEKGASDSQHTVLLGQIVGYPRDRAGVRSCTDAPNLVWADGTVQDITSIETSSDEQAGGILSVRYEFSAAGAAGRDATLEIPCLLFDASYRGWSMPLHFQAAEGTNQVIPAIELPTPIPSQPAAASVPAPAAESAPAGFAIVLKSVADLPDGYVLSGSYQWSDVNIDSSAVVISNSDITDAHGKEVPYQEVETDASAAAGPQEIPFAYQISGKHFAWPLKLIVNRISIVQPGQGTFQFDAGPNPQLGQTWDVSIDVPVGRHVIHVQRIELASGGPNAQDMLGYDFTMTSDPAVASATVEDLHPIINCLADCAGGGGGGGGFDVGPSGTDATTGPFSYRSVAKGYAPAGLKTFVISNMSVFIKGPWEASWQP